MHDSKRVEINIELNLSGTHPEFLGKNKVADEAIFDKLNSRFNSNGAWIHCIFILPPVASL